MNIKKSVNVLKSLQLKNGGIMATPLNGAYPYVYTRDAVIVTKAMNKVGMTKESEEFYYFIKKFSKIENYKEVFQRYNQQGLPSVTRRNENDNEGLLLHGIYDTFKKSKNETFLENIWPVVDSTAKLIISYSRNGLLKTSASIHEYDRLEKGYEIWSNSAAVRGLKDASEMGKFLKKNKEAEIWSKKADKILYNIKKRLFNKQKGIFIKNPRFKEVPDISILAPFYFEILDDKKILKKTMNHLRKHLWNDELGGFRRFRKFEVVKDWHWYTGGSGSWVMLTFWALRFYRKLKDKKGEKECIEWIKKVASKSNGLLPEHIATREEYEDWKKHEIEFNNRIINESKKCEKSETDLNGKRIVYWALPLGWSHAEHILTEAE